MVVLDLCKEASFLSYVTGCSDEQAYEYVNLEDQYFDLIGLNVYETIEKDDLISDIVVEDEVMDKFILEHSKLLTNELIEKLNEAELQYFKIIGLVD